MVCGEGEAGRQIARELERLFQRERGAAASALEAAGDEAKTRLLFVQFARCDPPLRPPTHSRSGLPRRDAQRGYARLFDRLTDLAAQGQIARCPHCGQFGLAAGHLACPAGVGDAEPAVLPGGTDKPASASTQREYSYRNAEVEAEVTALPEVCDPAFVRQALAARQPETAAHAIRRLLQAGKRDQARQVGEHLAELISPRLAAVTRAQFPGQPELREELLQELSARTWEELVDLRPGKDFISYNFPCVLNRNAAKLAWRLRQTGRHERQFARGNAGDEPWSEEDMLVAATPPPEARAVAEEMLSTVPPRARLTIMLLARGVPISSPNPREVSIAGLLGVTARSVHNYRRAAAQQIQAAGLAPPKWLRKLDYSLERRHAHGADHANAGERG